MPGLTRTQCTTRIRTLLSEPTARYFTDAEIQTWINDGVRDISIKTFCNTVICTAIDTVVGCAEYTWPSTLNTTAIATLGIKTIVLSSKVSLQYVTPEQLGRVAVDGAQNMKWTSWHQQIVFSHAPTAIMTFQPYVWVEARQTADTTLEIPAPYHHLVTLYGTFMGHMKRLELEAANYVYGVYQQELDRIANIINPIYSPTPMKNGLQDQGETP